MSNKIYIGQDLLIDPSVSYTKAETDQKISDLVDLAPGALDTLNELAAALGDDANFATTVTANIATNTANIATNTAKVGITPTQAADIVTNNAKVGITPTQASDISTALQPTDPTLDSVTSNGATTTNNVVVGSKFATGNNVVSGLDSLAIGGSGNTASGINSEVIGSDGSTASSQGSTIVGGYNNNNDGNWSATLGGINQNVATGANRSAIVAGFGHNMNHIDSVILGGSNITTDAGNTVFVPSLNVGAGFKMPTGAADGYVLTSDASGVGTWEAGGAAWGDITGTLSSQTDLQSALDAKKVRTDANGAFSAGDLGGNARGTNAINIQATRSAVTQVASTPNSVAIGTNSTSSAYYGGSVAIGLDTTASGMYGTTAIGDGAKALGGGATALGYRTEASGFIGSTASGYSCKATGWNSTAIGAYTEAAGDDSTAVGKYAKTTVNGTTEIGYWLDRSTRGGAIRFHNTGMVSQTIQNRSTAYGDGGATKGSEANNTVIREGIALRRNGNEILFDLNIGGTVTTLSLGTAS